MRQHVVDAGRLLMPAKGDPHGPLAPLLLGLTLVTGVVDAFSYLELNHVLVANMTGNVVFGGFALAGVAGFLWWALLLAIAGFLVGAWTGGRIGRTHGAHRGRHLFVATSVELVFLTAAWVVALLTKAPFRGWAVVVLVLSLGIGMGIQNAAARALAVPDLTTTVLTLTLTGIAADAVSSAGSRLGRRLVPVATMFLGALSGAALVTAGHPVATVGLAAAALTVVVGASGLAARSTSTWARGR